MKKVWFIYDKNFVSGPNTTEHIKNKVIDGDIAKTSLVWWKGQRDWIELENWQNNLTRYEKQIKEPSEEAVWYALKDGHTLGPSTKTELITILSNLNNLSKIRVWKKGQEKWATVYQYQDISDQLGITKRKFPRAPILGEVSIMKNGNESYAASATISAGGIGLTKAIGLAADDNVELTIRSPLLVLAIKAKAKVKHNSQNYCGLEFVEISDDAKEIISEYVNQFEGPSTQYLKPAV